MPRTFIKMAEQDSVLLVNEVAWPTTHGSVRMSNVYAIYYGWMIEGERGAPNEAAQRLADAQLPILVCDFWTREFNRRQNVTPKVLALFQSAGTALYAHIETRWGGADIEDVKQRASECLDNGADGIFFNEVGSLEGDYQLEYYQPLFKHVRGYGKRVILNPGCAKIGQGMAGISDLMMVGHHWRTLGADCAWAPACPERFMGVSRNDDGGMGYPIDLDSAVRDTKEAWALGLEWHYSTDKFAELPDWFEAYLAAVRC